MREHRLSRTPDSRTLAQATASYVSRRSSRCLPLGPAYLDGQDCRDGVGSQEARRLATRRALSTAIPFGETHACPV
jgi:hypothetical protein